MAVSGRKLFDCKEAVSKALEENPDDSCGPCSAFDRRTEPHGYCVDCQEYLCKDCYIYHQKVKASKHHQLLDKSHIHKKGIPSNTSDVCTERCSTHKNEVIKFYCPKHDVLGCSDCMTLNHRTCDLDYIPDKCKDIGDSDEYNDIIRTLEEKSNKVKDITSKAAVKDKEIDEIHEAATIEIQKYRQEINDRLDIIQMKSQTEVKNRRSSDKRNIQSIMASCTVYSSEINKLKLCLQDSKTRKESGQLFIDLKRAKNALVTTSADQAEASLDNVYTKYHVRRNEDIESILFQQAGLVNFSELDIKMPTSPRKSDTISLTKTEDINVKTNSDKIACHITGCEILTTDKLVIADNANKAIKIVDLQRKVVIGERKIDVCPYDITVVPNGQIAVTTERNRKIMIATTAPTLTINKAFTVRGSCYGIVYHEDALYVVCQEPRRIIVTDMNGNVKNTISLNDDTRFFGASYIAKSYSDQTVYVSTWGSSAVVRLTLQDEIAAVYNGFTKDVQKPRGMIIYDDESILVCCFGSGKIYRLSSDLAQGWIIKDGLNEPRSICYSSERNELYVGSRSSDYLRVFRLQ